ncbi:MAG: DUF2378 family protein [Myxococcaceae bacterium]|nr:DUF2378 family protein [Myxococcaceae bacterium]
MATPVEQRVIFPVQAEGLLRGLGADVSPRLKATLKALDLDPDNEFPPAWPAERLRAWLDAASDDIYQDLPREEAHRRIGRRFIDGWQRTLIGAASAQFLKVIGPRRALERLTRAFRTGDNFSQSSVTFPGDTVALVTLNTQSLPDYIAGILDGGLALLGVQGRVTIERVAGDDMDFRVEWEKR